MGQYFLMYQYGVPILASSIRARENSSLVDIVEHILKLSMVSVLVWLLMFYSFFHCFLNITAEVLQFGDREFYLAWWNARDIADYWRQWNLPVYNWGRSHIYLPMVASKQFSASFATLTVFTISAVLHELLIGVPVHNVSGVAFTGMMLQIPVIMLTRTIHRLRRQFMGDINQLLDTIGNYIFWLAFCIVGQPTLVLLYYWTWYEVFLFLLSKIFIKRNISHPFFIDSINQIKWFEMYSSIRET
jgi:diacylglycerol O-acyltransferase-1